MNIFLFFIFLVLHFLNIKIYRHVKKDVYDQCDQLDRKIRDMARITKSCPGMPDASKHSVYVFGPYEFSIGSLQHAVIF